VPPASADGSGQRGTALNLIAGVGVLLLAMGVGVLIGRANAPKQSAAPASVITVGAAPSAVGTSSATTEASFSGSWPTTKTGYTVQLQTLPVAGTTVKAVEAAKTAATGKGAPAVGALKSEEFSSLSAGSYVIYSGEYHKQAEADKALAGLKKSFPGAKVVKVSNSSASASSAAPAAGGGATPSAPSSETHPAPFKAVEESKGKTAEEKSKDIPNVVETP